MKPEFSARTHISNFTKIRLVGAEFFRAEGQTDGRTDRQTDMTELAISFRNFEEKRLKSRKITCLQIPTVFRVSGGNIFLNR